MAEQKFRAIGSSALSPTDNKKRKEVFITKSFDEQIQFTNANGALLSHIKYTLTMDNGAIVDGITDEQGRTRRIQTGAPAGIKEAKLQPVKAGHFCTAHAPELPDFLTFEINGVKTNSVLIGTSLVKINTPEGKPRGLTLGEITMAQLIYKNSIDYKKVKIHNGEYLWFGLQPNKTAMTPDGEIYISPKEFREDFSKEDIYNRIWFMHEMAHVWQYQLGYPTKLRGMIRIGLSYDYTLTEDKHLYDYNMEAQGDILADYWALLDANGTPPKFMNQRKHINDIKLYEKVLKHFIHDPSRALSLPFGK